MDWLASIGPSVERSGCVLQAFPAWYKRLPNHPMWQKNAIKQWLDNGVAKEWIQLQGGLVDQLRASAKALAMALSYYASSFRSTNVAVGNRFLTKKVIGAELLLAAVYGNFLSVTCIASWWPDASLAS